MPLTKNEKTYCCPSAHSYDIARQGYVNLLTQGAGQHGDNKEMVVARNRFLCNGFYENLGKSLAIGFK
ncbi:MAG: methyltransferase type 11, partial [Clostridia bacterium]|nr:methyltransferase type 11 [Clostridia bacterium]